MNSSTNTFIIRHGKVLLDAGGGHIKIWDVSPELPGASELIRELTEEGVICSMSHTRCNHLESPYHLS